jgi:hypothetical protein
LSFRLSEFVTVNIFIFRVQTCSLACFPVCPPNRTFP